MVDEGGAGHRTDIKQNTSVGLQHWTEGVEEPSMRVDFLLVFLFQVEDDLDPDNALLGAFDFHRRGYQYCERVRNR